MPNPEKLCKVIRFLHQNGFPVDKEAYYRTTTISWLLDDNSQCAEPQLPLKTLIELGADPARRVRSNGDARLPEQNGDNAKWTKKQTVRDEVIKILVEARKKRRFEKTTARVHRCKRVKA